MQIVWFRVGVKEFGLVAVEDNQVGFRFGRGIVLQSHVDWCLGIDERKGEGLNEPFQHQAHADHVRALLTRLGYQITFHQLEALLAQSGRGEGLIPASGPALTRGSGFCGLKLESSGHGRSFPDDTSQIRAVKVLSGPALRLVAAIERSPVSWGGGAQPCPSRPGVLPQSLEQPAHWLPRNPGRTIPPRDG